MATPPVFSAGAVLTAAQMNAVGLWLVTTDTVTSGTSKTVTNAFSDDYENYRILITNLATSGTTNIMFRFGTDATAYYGSNYVDLYNGTGTQTNRANNATSLYTGIAESGSTGSSAMTFDVWGVRTTNTQKGITGTMYGAGYTGWFGGIRATTSKYTSFTIYTLTGATFSAGEVYVYGYRK